MMKTSTIVFALLGLAACGHWWKGSTGSPGLPGKDGQSIVGPSGAPGPSGSPGIGIQGLMGPAGVNGQDATPVVVVQFCAGYTTKYPTSFPEKGLLINGVLYGVYDGGANDVFLAALPPGRYRSTSTGAPCDFTVNLDGSVSL